MPEKTTKKASPDSQVTADLHAAIDRLLAGKPNHRTLKQKAARGKLKLNISTVAQEAGRSRTLIALPMEEELEDIPLHERPKSTCAYPEVRKRVLDLMKPVNSTTDSNAVISRLRSENKDLRDMLRNALNEAREHLTARQVAERDRDRWRSNYRRTFDARKGSAKSNVLPFVALDSLNPDNDPVRNDG